MRLNVIRLFLGQIRTRHLIDARSEIGRSNSRCGEVHVDEILIAVIDGLRGLPETIESVYPYEHS